MTSNSSNKIPIIVAGALGKMGSEVIKTVVNSTECELIAAIETSVEDGTDIGSTLGIKNIAIETSSDFEATMCNASQLNRNDNYLRRPVLVDFTHPSVVYEHCRGAIAYGVNPVIGTTGLSVNQLNGLAEFSEKASIGAAVIPNFSVGMVLLQQAAAAAASFYDHVELTELHHNQKADAPSGTCIKTAELIEESCKIFNNQVVNETETIQSVRGGKRDSGIRIHSLRLPGLVAHQEVMFGSIGETYKLIHNTIDRSAYMPGVLMTIKKIGKINHLIYGLERIL